MPVSFRVLVKGGYIGFRVLGCRVFGFWCLGVRSLGYKVSGI